jgi:hypothetical protein
VAVDAHAAVSHLDEVALDDDVIADVHRWLHRPARDAVVIGERSARREGDGGCGGELQEGATDATLRSRRRRRNRWRQRAIPA